MAASKKRDLVLLSLEVCVLCTCADLSWILKRRQYDAKVPGLRKFLVTTWKEFWQHYKEMDAKERFFYEVIREGLGSRLYFDLEFSVPLNPNINQEDIMDSFKDFCVLQIKSALDLDCPKSDIVDLSSTTSVKFSRHLIFHLPGTVFANNVQVGIFVQRNIINPILQITLSPQNDDQKAWQSRLEKLFVKNDKGESELFIDEGVYTKNRSFRLFMSSKLGKNTPLVISETSGRIPKGACVGNGRLIRLRNHDGVREDVEAHEIDQEAFFMDTLVAPSPLPSDTRLLTLGNDSLGTSTPPQKGSKIKSASTPSDGLTSPFPMLHEFLLSQIFRRSIDPNPNARIKKSTFFPESK